MKTTDVMNKLSPVLNYSTIIQQEKAERSRLELKRELERMEHMANVESKAKLYLKENMQELLKTQEYKKMMLAHIIQRGGNLNQDEKILSSNSGKALISCAIMKFDTSHPDYGTEHARIRDAYKRLKNKISKVGMENLSPAEIYLNELSFSANRKLPFYQLSFDDFAKLIIEKDGKEQLMLVGDEKKQFYRMLNEKDYTVGDKTYEQKDDFVGFILKDDKNSQKAVLVDKKTGERMDFKDYIDIANQTLEKNANQTLKNILQANSEIVRYNQSVIDDLLQAIQGDKDIQEIKTDVKSVLEQINEKRYLLDFNTETKVKQFVDMMNLMEREKSKNISSQHADDIHKKESEYVRER